MPLRPAPGYDQSKDYFNMVCNVFHQAGLMRPATPVTYQVPKGELPDEW
jgi:hypothetical protein